MTSPTDLVPNRYEVIKLKDGAEIVGMTKDCGDYLEITLPMICQLSIVPGTPRTNAVFYPYSPLSSDERVQLPKSQVVHRNLMNPQFIEFYDNASSKWFDMIENQSIPLMTKQDEKVADRMRGALNDMMSKYQHLDNASLDRALEDLEFEDDFDEDYIIDKKKLH